MSNLISTSDIAEMFNVTRQAVFNWQKRKPSFPKPFDKLRTGPVWKRKDIISWGKREGKI